jgi:hypothetical protein
MSTTTWTTANLQIMSRIKNQLITFHYRLFTRSGPLPGPSSSTEVDTLAELPDDANDGDILADGDKTFHYREGQWVRAGSYTPSPRNAKKKILPTDAVHLGLTLRIVDGSQEWVTQSAFRSARNRQLQDDGNSRSKKRQRINTNCKHLVHHVRPSC